MAAAAAASRWTRRWIRRWTRRWTGGGWKAKSVPGGGRAHVVEQPAVERSAFQRTGRSSGYGTAVVAAVSADRRSGQETVRAGQEAATALGR
jgi:hypothetical protein